MLEQGIGILSYYESSTYIQYVGLYSFAIFFIGGRNVKCQSIICIWVHNTFYFGHKVVKCQSIRLTVCLTRSADSPSLSSLHGSFMFYVHFMSCLMPLIYPFLLQDLQRLFACRNKVVLSFLCWILIVIPLTRIISRPRYRTLSAAAALVSCPGWSVPRWTRPAPLASVGRGECTWDKGGVEPFWVCWYTGVHFIVRSRFREEEKLPSSGCCRQENATFSPYIHGTQSAP